MLISFSVQNFLSFKDKVTISAVAGRQTIHRDRVPQVKKYGLRILPVLALYGANASGKTNLVEALLFIKQFVTKGCKVDELIGVTPFLLSAKTKDEPSSFEILLLEPITETIYEYSFSVTPKKVVSERLRMIKPASETALYERDVNGIQIHGNDKAKRLSFIADGTRDNVLFLTNTVEQNDNHYKKVFDWFKNLKIIQPNAKYSDVAELLDENGQYYNDVKKILGNLDTGITKLGAEKAPEVTEDFNDPSNSKKLVGILEEFTHERYFASSEGDKKEFKRIVSFHEDEDGNEVKFNLSQESDGTRRLLELLPAFIVPDFKDSAGVFIIDEFDRSLHHLLIRHLLERFLSLCAIDTRLQIIFTTHDLLLMDQELFRRDEMYIVENQANGGSSIIPLNEYKGIRSDKDILKSYLQGRFGGVPRI